jgi:hypothetical protein
MPPSLKPVLLIVAVWLGTSLPAVANEPGVPSAENWLRLDQFGPVDTPAAAAAALATGVRNLEQAGGGVLVIPSGAAAGWLPANQTQERIRTPAPPQPATSWKAGVGVTVVDLRRGSLRVTPPQSTGLVLRRVLKLPPGQGLPDGAECPLVEIVSREAGGPGHPALDREPVVGCSTKSHNENQTFDVCLWRHSYSQGDAALVDARLRSMGDMRPAADAAPRSGAIYVAEVESLTDVFRGQVERYDAASGRLVFTAAANAHTLGSGRPIINLNPAKLVTSDKTFVMQPAGAVLGWGGTVRSTDPAWHAGVVGRFFAIDEPGEHVPGTDKVRRWWLISDYREEGGVKRLSLTRHWWGAKHACGLTQLYDPENFTVDPARPRFLRSIIAPGGYAYDVADGVESAVVNPNGSARMIRLAPGPCQGGDHDFSPGDPIEQAIGPDPFRPQPFRSWLFEKVPGAFPAPVFDVANRGDVGRDSVLWVRGDAFAAPGRQPEQARPALPWNELVSIEASCGTGIVFAGDTIDAAIRFDRPAADGDASGGRAARLVWRWSEPALKRTTLGVDARGRFRVAAPALAVAGASAVRVGGLSAGRRDEAANLRGVAVPVAAEATSVQVRFERPEPDGGYLVIARTTWVTNHAVRERTPDGFMVEFDRPAPPNATVDWLVVH